MYCEKCGAQLKENARFCEKCGKEVVLKTIQTPKKDRWIDKIKSGENWGYKIMGLAVLFLLIIASYTKFANGYRVCMVWPIHIVFVVTSWISAVKAIIYIDKPIFWNKIRTSLILRTIPIFVTWIIIRLFLPSFGEVYYLFYGFPVFAALCGLAAILVIAKVIKTADENGMEKWDEIQRMKGFNIISFVNSFCAIICGLSGFLSFAKDGKYGFLLLHITKLNEYNSALSAMSAWGFLLIALGVFVVCLSSFASSKTSIISAVVSLFMFIINMCVVNNRIIVEGFRVEEIAKASGYYFMIIGPIICLIASVIKAIYVNITERNIFIKHYEEKH